MGSYHPFLKAIPYTIIFFAIVHLLLSFFYSILHGDPDIANMFHVLGFDLFWPEIGKGGLNALISATVVALTGIAAALILRWRDRQADRLRESTKRKAKQ